MPFRKVRYDCGFVVLVSLPENDVHLMICKIAALEDAYLILRIRLVPSILENDWLDAIVMLPDQLFYNTGIYTYVWLLRNSKPKSHRDRVMIIAPNDFGSFSNCLRASCYSAPRSTRDAFG
jgi:hypothetical protein